MPSPIRSGRRAHRLALVPLVVVLSLLGTGIGGVQPPVHASTIAAPTGAITRPAGTASHPVTLLTGDVVTVTTLADGRQTAEVDRPDGATGGVHIRQIGDDLYVLPEEALPLVTGDRLDRRLFNVADLIELGYDDARGAELPLIAT